MQVGYVWLLGVQRRWHRSSTTCAAVSATCPSASSPGSVRATRRARWPRWPVDRVWVTRCCSSSARASACSASAAFAPTSACPRTSPARLSATAAFTGCARCAPSARRPARPGPSDPPTWPKEERLWNVPELQREREREEDSQLMGCSSLPWLQTLCSTILLSSVDA